MDQVVGQALATFRRLENGVDRQDTRNGCRMTAGPLIVLATDSSVPSGVGEHMLTLARALEARYQVALAFPHGGMAPASCAAACKPATRPEPYTTVAHSRGGLGCADRQFYMFMLASAGKATSSSRQAGMQASRSCVPNTFPICSPTPTKSSSTIVRPGWPMASLLSRKLRPKVTEPKGFRVSSQYAMASTPPKPDGLAAKLAPRSILLRMCRWS